MCIRDSISSGYRNAVNQGQLRTYYAGGLVGGNLSTIKNCYTNLQDLSLIHI